MSLGESGLSKILKIEDGTRDEIPGLRTVLKFIDEKTGAKKIAVMMVIYEPGVKSGGVHYHERRESAYIVLEGTAKMSLNGVEHELKPGMAVFLSPGYTHGIVGTGTETFKMIEVYSPIEPDRIDVP